MAWVQKDGSGNIIGCFAVRQPGTADQEVANNDPALLAFIATVSSTPDPSDMNNVGKQMKALALLTRKYANDLKAGTFVTKTIADTRSDFAAIYQALP